MIVCVRLRGSGERGEEGKVGGTWYPHFPYSHSHTYTMYTHTHTHTRTHTHTHTCTHAHTHTHTHTPQYGFVFRILTKGRDYVFNAVSHAKKVCAFVVSVHENPTYVVFAGLLSSFFLSEGAWICWEFYFTKSIQAFIKVLMTIFYATNKFSSPIVSKSVSESFCGDSISYNFHQVRKTSFTQSISQMHRIQGQKS